MKLSFLEIYNDQMIDLLSESPTLQIKEGPSGINIDNLSVHDFSDLEEAEKILKHALYNRKVFETTKNT